ncbi:MAG: alkaline phosphatase [Ahniella sp.]|nr:alkaline phosphatase [Ahniella sp.]
MLKRGLSWTLACMVGAAATQALAESPRSAIFLHPDGMGANTWNVVRLQQVGPDGRLAWDRLPKVAMYVGPMLDSVNASSNGGATTHAYGIRAHLGAFGTDPSGQRPNAASGRPTTVLQDAMAAGKKVALINSSSVTEPGTAAFIASVANRDDEAEIAAQLLAAKPDFLLGGGETFFLPKGTKGRHGEGMRTDGRNLVDEARAAGYTVVFTAEELAQVDQSATRVLGLFATEETFNELTEEQMTKQGLPPFQPQAPRFDRMLAFVLERLRDAPNGYLVVGNEEGTDNLSGENNVPATLEAAAGADRAIALALEESKRNPALTLVVCSDSDNGGMNATSDDLDELPLPLGNRSENGSVLSSDGGKPYLSAPDRRGKQIPYYVVWASNSDMAGGTVARGIGPGAALIEGTIDSTRIYEVLRFGLFGSD